MSDEFLKTEDFEEMLELGNVIIIPEKTEIKISCVFSEVKEMSTGPVHMREETHLIFHEEECFLIPSGQFGKILSAIKARLIEKGVTDGEEERQEPEPGDPTIN
jgi:hypothetical protein